MLQKFRNLKNYCGQTFYKVLLSQNRLYLTQRAKINGKPVLHFVEFSQMPKVVGLCEHLYKERAADRAWPTPKITHAVSAGCHEWKFTKYGTGRKQGKDPLLCI